MCSTKKNAAGKSAGSHFNTSRKASNPPHEPPPTMMSWEDTMNPYSGCPGSLGVMSAQAVS
jgi:hypothetical protein